MTKRLTLTQFQKLIPKLTPQLEKAAVRGMRKAAIYLNRTVVIEIGQASPHPAVDTGELRNSVDTTPVPGGAIVAVDAPHAPVMEYGRRPGARMPPVDVIEEWMRRKGVGRDLINRQRKGIAQSAIRTVGRSAAIAALKRDRVALEDTAIRQAAFVMARSIAKNGIKPRFFFKKAWDRSVDHMALAFMLEIAKTDWKPKPQTKAALKAMFAAPKKGAA